MSPLPDYSRAANTLEAGRIRRYHAVPTVEVQTVGQHSWGVAVLCHYITGGEASRDLLVQALLHDAAELYTGDMPFTVKRQHPELKEMLGELEAVAHNTLVMPGIALTPHDAAVLKMADTVEGLIWCRKTEVKGAVRERWRAALNQGFDKFYEREKVLSEAEVQRIVDLVNEENFWPTI